jgi:hypothetical protein
VDLLPPFTCDLRHGLKLTLGQPVEHVPLYGLVNLLADAMTFFKEQRDTRKVATYSSGPYVAVVENRGVTFARLEISHPGDDNENFLSTADWTDAVIDVFSVADTVQDIVRQKAAYRKAIARTGKKGWIREALKLIGTPVGDLQALALNMKEHLAKEAA